MSTWTKVKAKDILVEEYKGTHNWKKFKSRFLPWVYCQHCGFIWLNNDIAHVLAKKSCPPWDYYYKHYRRR